MKFLIFDTETNSFSRKFGRVTQLAFLLCDEKGNELSKFSELIYPDGWYIPKKEFFIENGMFTERNKKYGIPMAQALIDFNTIKQEADVLVAHNFSFDKPMMDNEYRRYKIKDVPISRNICTLIESRNNLNLPKNKLEDVYRYLTGKEMENAHDAYGDVFATKEILIEMINRELIEI